MKSLKKKAVFNQLSDLAVGLVGLAILLAIAFLILANVGTNSQVMDDPNASAAVNTTISAMEDIPGWLPIIVIVVIGAILIGLIAFFRQRT